MAKSGTNLTSGNAAPAFRYRSMRATALLLLQLRYQGWSLRTEWGLADDRCADNNETDRMGADSGLPVWSQRADRARLVDAALDLGLRHLARDARLHRWRLHLVRHGWTRRAGRALGPERCSRHRGGDCLDLPDVARAARDLW